MAARRNEGIRHFYLRAETFTHDKAWARGVAEAIRAACPDARWVTTTRLDCVDEPTLAAMAAGGCYGISFGADAVSRLGRESVGKSFAVETAHEAMRLMDVLERVQVQALASPRLTGEWQFNLRQVQDGDLTREDVLDRLKTYTRAVVEAVTTFEHDEIYADDQAFDDHLKTAHFAAFNTVTADLVKEKRRMDFRVHD